MKQYWIEPIFMDKSTLQDRYLVSWFLKKIDTKKQMTCLVSCLGILCLSHMYVNFFHYMTLCLWVFNHSHICQMKKHMKNCMCYFHSILLFRSMEAIQNYLVLTLHGDFGLSGIWYLNDVNTDSLKHAKN